MQERSASSSGDYTTSSRHLMGGDERHSVLKSVDQLIRDQYQYDAASSPQQQYRRFLSYSSSLPGGGRIHHGHGGQVTIVSPCASEEDRSIERIASTFRSGEEGGLLYYGERRDVGGFMSPMATDSESMGSELGGVTPAAMPILPDMPTRSRRLLEDLGSAPIGRADGGSRGHPIMKGKYSVASAAGLSGAYRTVL